MSSSFSPLFTAIEIIKNNPINNSFTSKNMKLDALDTLLINVLEQSKMIEKQKKDFRDNFSKEKEKKLQDLRIKKREDEALFDSFVNETTEKQQLLLRIIEQNEKDDLEAKKQAQIYLKEKEELERRFVTLFTLMEEHANMCILTEQKKENNKKELDALINATFERQTIHLLNSDETSRSIMRLEWTNVDEAMDMDDKYQTLQKKYETLQDKAQNLLEKKKIVLAKERLFSLSDELHVLKKRKQELQEQDQTNEIIAHEQNRQKNKKHKLYDDDDAISLIFTETSTTTTETSTATSSDFTDINDYNNDSDATVDDEEFSTFRGVKNQDNSKLAKSSNEDLYQFGFYEEDHKEMIDHVKIKQDILEKMRIRTGRSQLFLQHPNNHLSKTARKEITKKARANNIKIDKNITSYFHNHGILTKDFFNRIKSFLKN